MTQSEQIGSTTEQNRTYSSSLRFWHWANGIVISGSLLTVLINSTILKGWTLQSFIHDELKKSGATVTDDQARSVSHALRDRVWDFHAYFGYFLVALLVFRLVVEFAGLTDQKLSRKIAAYYRQYKAGQNKLMARGELFVKSLYAAFYLILIVLAITGLCLVFEDDVPVLHKMHFIKEIHGFCLYLVLAFLFLHIAGVYLAERKNKPGIVSDMINGGNKK